MVRADPRAGARLVVAESALNVACVGAAPVALVNCLNFGNPEHPEVMWQLSEAIDGMAEACTALEIPVVGGNVSLYNESRGTDIDPTPVSRHPGPGRPARPGTPGAGLRKEGTVMFLGPSARVPYPWPARGRRLACRPSQNAGGALPPLDLGLHARLLKLVALLVNERLVDGVHDVSDGGLAVALAEMAVKSGTGCRVNGISGIKELFGEGAVQGGAQRAARERGPGGGAGQRRRRPYCAARRSRRRPLYGGGPHKSRPGRG